MYLVFTTNWGHKNENYLQIRNNNNNVYTIKWPFILLILHGWLIEEIPSPNTTIRSFLAEVNLQWMAGSSFLHRINFDSTDDGAWKSHIWDFKGLSYWSKLTSILQNCPIKINISS